MSSKIEVQKRCEQCGDEFIAKTTVTRYCSHKCSSTAYKARKRNEKLADAGQRPPISDRSAQRPILEHNYNLIREKEFLTVKEAAVLLGCSKRTIYRLIENGTIKAMNFSQRMTRIRRAYIDGLLEEREKQDASEPVQYDIAECYHLSEIQQSFGVSEKALYEIIKRNSIPKIRHGRHTYVPKSLIDNLF